MFLGRKLHFWANSSIILKSKFPTTIEYFIGYSFMIFLVKIDLHLYQEQGYKACISLTCFQLSIAILLQLCKQLLTPRDSVSLTHAGVMSSANRETHFSYFFLCCLPSSNLFHYPCLSVTMYSKTQTINIPIVVMTVPAKKKAPPRSQWLLLLEEFPMGLTPALSASTACCKENTKTQPHTCLSILCKLVQAPKGNFQDHGNSFDLSFLICALSIVASSAHVS